MRYYFELNTLNLVLFLSLLVDNLRFDFVKLHVAYFFLFLVFLTFEFVNILQFVCLVKFTKFLEILKKELAKSKNVEVDHVFKVLLDRY
jgi:hypothetical protein